VQQQDVEQDRIGQGTTNETWGQVLDLPMCRRVEGQMNKSFYDFWGLQTKA
jgi:hypothetical protein